MKCPECGSKDLEGEGCFGGFTSRRKRNNFKPTIREAVTYSCNACGCDFEQKNKNYKGIRIISSGAAVINDIQIN